MDRNALVGSRIVAARDLSGMKAKELAAILGITTSRLSNWENGISGISAEYIFKISDALGVTSDYLIGLSNTPREIAPELISMQMFQTVVTMRQLNNDGQDKVLDQAKLLKHSGLYDAEKAIEFNEDQFVALYTAGSAAAGSAFAYGDEITNYRVIMTTEIPKHDFTIDVVGDSMFPTIYDGDIVFVKRAADHVDKRIYVLDIDGETVIKRVIFGNNQITLLSDNPEWKDRIVTGQELASTRILGEVIGWETPV